MRPRSEWALAMCGAVASVVLVPIGIASGESPMSDGADSDETSSVVRNGGFENPVIERPWVAFFADGERRIPGWRVVRRSVDIGGTDWPAGRGSQSMGVNGYRRGWVSQLVATKADTAYRLSFLLWGDPNGPPPRSRLAVRWDLERVAVRKVNVRTQSTRRRIAIRVESTDAGTPLGFRSLTNGNAGPAIDRVRLVPLHQS